MPRVSWVRNDFVLKRVASRSRLKYQILRTFTLSVQNILKKSLTWRQKKRVYLFIIFFFVYSRSLIFRVFNDPKGFSAIAGLGVTVNFQHTSEIRSAKFAAKCKHAYVLCVFFSKINFLHCFILLFIFFFHRNPTRSEKYYTFDISNNTPGSFLLFILLFFHTILMTFENKQKFPCNTQYSRENASLKLHDRCSLTSRYFAVY